MEDIEKLKIEADELAKKIIEANNLLLGEMRKNGSEAQKHLLDRQIKAMKEYLDILEMRKKICIVEQDERKMREANMAKLEEGINAEEPQDEVTDQ